MASTEKFSIDDAFRLDEADAQLNVYGSTTENIPLTTRSPSADRIRKQHEDSQRDSRFLRSENINSFASASHEEAYGTPGKTFQYKYWWRHPHVQQNYKTVLAAFLLVLVGLALLATGIALEATRATGIHSFMFFIAAAVCLIPGVYHGVYVYCAVKGHQGYTFYHLPVFR